MSASTPAAGVPAGGVPAGHASDWELPGWEHAYSGKVRELFSPRIDDTEDRALEGEPHVLVVATDRVSAYDFALEPGIPGKGELLTQLSLWWFDRLDVPNHLVDAATLDRIGVPGMRGGARTYATNRRARLVEHAISARLVTRENLPLLDLELASQPPADD